VVKTDFVVDMTDGVGVEADPPKNVGTKRGLSKHEKKPSKVGLQAVPPKGVGTAIPKQRKCKTASASLAGIDDPCSPQQRSDVDTASPSIPSAMPHGSVEDVQLVCALVKSISGDSKWGMIKTSVYIHDDNISHKSKSVLYSLLSASSIASLVATLKSPESMVKLRLFRAGNDKLSGSISGDGLCALRNAIVMQKFVTTTRWMPDLRISVDSQFVEFLGWTKFLLLKLQSLPNKEPGWEQTHGCVQGIVEFLSKNQTWCGVLPDILWLPCDSVVFISAALGIRYTCFVPSSRFQMTKRGISNGLSYYEAKSVGNI
jgi:hypothetical protein